jgi:hypothetical protein
VKADEFKGNHKVIMQNNCFGLFYSDPASVLYFKSTAQVL